MIAFLCSIGAVFAAPSLDGGSGLVTLPTVATTERGEIGGSVSLNVVSASERLWMSGMPMGLAAGISRRSEVGVRIDRDPWAPGSKRTSLPGGVGFQGRYRFVDPSKGRFGLGLHVALLNVQKDPGGEAFVLIQRPIGPIDLHVATGGRYSDAHGTDWTTGAGLSSRLAPRVEVVAEGDISVGEQGVRGFGGRAAGRFYLDGNFAAMAWAGGGSLDDDAWVGGGAALAIFSQGPLVTDRDGDTTPDLADRCPYVEEDVDSFEDEDGCPDKDNDRDGIPDAIDPTPDGVPVLHESAEQFPTETPQMHLVIHTPIPAGSSHVEDRKGKDVDPPKPEGTP